tara:strand:+ start:222 stop:1406 length:1185 start_codon:yes stop_codon:yes gene_type:complete
MNTIYKNYLYVFLISTLIIFILVISTNRLIDPYSFFYEPTKQEFNFLKPYIPTTRAKALAILKIRPKTIILGSSRTESGVDPNHALWDLQPVFNAAFGGADIYDSFYFLKHANSTGELKKAVIMVDFFMFNAQRKMYKEENYEFLELIEKQSELFKFETLKYLISLQTIGDSFKTLMNKDLTNELNIDYGLRKVPQVTFPYSKFISTESAFYKVHYHNFKTQNSYQDNQKAFEWIIDFSIENNIDLSIGISPIHARLLEVLYVKGHQEEFENWKRNLIQILELKKGRNLQNKVNIYDFSGFNTYTSEAIPNKENKEDIQTNMEWYLEPSHYKKSLGNKIIERLLTEEDNSKNSFGIKLNKDNIEEHLVKIQNERELWKNKFPQYSKEIHSLKQH